MGHGASEGGFRITEDVPKMQRHAVASPGHASLSSLCCTVPPPSRGWRGVLQWINGSEMGVGC